MPDYGRITTYRSAGGFAVRLDGGNGFGGAVITPYYDSLLVKVTTWGTTLEEAVQRMRPRAARVPHPRREDEHPVPAQPDRPPDVPRPARRRRRSSTTRRSCSSSARRATARRKMLTYLGDVIVNGRPDVKGSARPGARAADARAAADRRDASRRRRARGSSCRSSGPEKFAEWIREREAAADHRHDVARRAPVAAGDARAHLRHARRSPTRSRDRLPNLFSLEMWGGATFDTSMRFLQEDPWERLTQLRAADPEHPVPDAAARQQRRRLHDLSRQRRARVRQAKRRRAGIDVFRIFDSLNSTAEHAAWRSRRCASDTDAHLRGGDLLHRRHPRSRRARSTSCDYYVELAKELEKMGTHILGDQGHGRAVQAVRGERAGEGAARGSRRADPLPHARHERHQRRQRAARGRGRRRHRRRGDRVDERHDQPAEPELARRGAAPHRARHRPRPGRRSTRSADYWAAVRELYYPFEEGLKAPDAEVYQHEMPGGQYTNLRQQAKSLGLERPLAGDLRRPTPRSISCSATSSR